MATQLPIILDISTRSNHDDHDPQPSPKKTRRSSSFLSGLQFGSLQTVPQPGDVHYPPMGSRQARPLGLIPNRNNRLAALKKLNQLLSPRPSQPVLTTQPLASTHPLPQHQDVGAGPTISASVDHSQAPADSEAANNRMDVDPVAYRLALAGRSDGGVDGDPDYMGDRATEYYALAPGAGPLPSVQTSARGIGQSVGAGQLNNTHNTDRKISSLKRWFRTYS